MGKNELKVATPTDNEIMMTRSFDAPRRLVFDALTRPELVKRWFYGPDGWQFVTCEIDLHVGGAYRYVIRQDGKKDVAWGGVYREIVTPELLVYTERFDDFADTGEALITTLLSEQGGKTTLTQTMLLPTKEVRDMVLATGMTDGVVACYDRLDGILAGEM